MRVRVVLGVIALLAVVVVAGIVLGWLGSKGPELKGQASSLSPTTPAPAAAQPSASVTTPKRKPSEEQPAPTQPATASTATNVIADWEDKVDEILQTEVPESEKAKKMLQMFPRLPEDGQVEIAQHLSNLVADEDYTSLGKLLTNDKLPEPVLEVLMADVLNRPNSLKLPLLLDVAKDAQHPKAEEARDLLELFLEENYGNNWGQWQAKMDQWLKDNPD
jgi:hypothetical protein